MAIRFACPGCQQPIEVDDEWASQQVGCPYCRKVVSAPAESTLRIDAVPTAAGGAGDAFAPPPPPPDARPVAPGFAGPSPRGRSLGRLAFASAAGGVVLTLIWWVMFADALAKHVDFEALQEQDLATQQRKIQEVMQQHGDELRSLSAYPLIGSLAGAMGIVLGVTTLLRNDPRKGLAIFSVILGTMAVPCNCIGLALFLMAPSV